MWSNGSADSPHGTFGATTTGVLLQNERQIWYSRIVETNLHNPWLSWCLLLFTVFWYFISNLRGWHLILHESCVWNIVSASRTNSSARKYYLLMYTSDPCLIVIINAVRDQIPFSGRWKRWKGIYQMSKRKEMTRGHQKALKCFLTSSLCFLFPENNFFRATICFYDVVYKNIMAAWFVVVDLSRRAILFPSNRLFWRISWSGPI